MVKHRANAAVSAGETDADAARGMVRAGETLGALLRGEGAVAYGSAPAAPVDESDWRFFREWLDRGFHAGMAYMENYPEIRRDPRLLIEGARTVVSVAFNYRQPNPYPQIATYALGRDYHKVLRRRLKRVAAAMCGEYGGGWRVCIDSAPILERYWARRCGIGRRSDFHGNVVVPGVGSMVFLAEVITTLDIELPATVLVPKPGKVDESASDVDNFNNSPYTPYNKEEVCPTGALQPGGTVDGNLCINYLTIEHRGELDAHQRRLIGKSLFGCDICQRVSAENRTLPVLPVLPEFHPLPAIGEFVKRGDATIIPPDSPIARGVRHKKVQ